MIAEFSIEKGVRMKSYIPNGSKIRIPKKVKKKIKKLNGYSRRLKTGRLFLCLGKRIFELTSETKVIANEYCWGVKYPMEYFIGKAVKE
jgi:hypothetical protein